MSRGEERRRRRRWRSRAPRRVPRVPGVGPTNFWPSLRGMYVPSFLLCSASFRLAATLFRSCDRPEIHVCMLCFRILEGSRAPTSFVSSATSVNLGDVPECITTTSKLFEGFLLLTEIPNVFHKASLSGVIAVYSSTPVSIKYGPKTPEIKRPVHAKRPPQSSV